MSDLEYPINVEKSVLRDETVELIEKISDWSYSHNWNELLKCLSDNQEYINRTRLARDSTTPPKLFTPLHQAAYGKAPKNVIENLLNLGASKTLKTTEGQTAYDIAVQKNMQQDILDILQVPEEIKKNEEEIKKMEKGLHKAILGRVEDLIKKNNMQLPQLSFLYEFEDFWFPVPGMYGGFHVCKCDKGVETSSWCRVAGGSGQKHLIDKQGDVKITEEGFV
ncbi:unnamed protein product [Meganyctiphanes norvegica]|uniref:Ankyrin repeat domain-containing protein n=1 Tax=Meganyctiphanes norvegica TaxID=48144 RepID=A0AAV2QZZ6_MEGNR